MSLLKAYGRKTQTNLQFLTVRNEMMKGNIAKYALNSPAQAAVLLLSCIQYLKYTNNRP